MRRLDCLKVINRFISPDDLVVVSLGGVVDEWHNIRPSGGNLFLEILGGITPVALGLAVALPHRKVFSLDTDGSFFMNTGVLCTLGNLQPQNLTVIILDNGCYECIGGPPTPSAGVVDIAKMAAGAGITNARTVRTLEELEEALAEASKKKGLSYIVLKLEPGTVRFPIEKRKISDGLEDKYNFLRHVERLEKIIIKPPCEQK